MPTPEKSLHELLVALFTVEQLRRFLTHEYGTEFQSTLPSGVVPLDELAFDATQELRRRRLIAAPLFAALVARAPGAHGEIAAVARQFRVAPPAPPLSEPAARPAPSSEIRPAPLQLPVAEQTGPLRIILELVRSLRAGATHAFEFTPQPYAMRSPGGAFEHADFPWTTEFLEDLRLVRTPGSSPEVMHRLGQTLRNFLGGAWNHHERAIATAARAGRDIHITIRSAAAEMYVVPWEMVTLKSTGQSLGGMPGVLVRYEWPDSDPAPDRFPHAVRFGRTLFAWSAAGGAVPASDHLTALRDAFADRPSAFDPSHDIIAHASLARIHNALADASHRGRPFDALHLLCHGARVGSTYGLALDSESGSGDRSVFDAGRLQQVLAPHVGMVRLIVLSACDSGDGGELGSHLGSVAQMLHRVGVQAVVGSRFPLSVRGSTCFTRKFFSTLVGGRASLERAFAAARSALMLDPVHLDWASVQLYGRETDGEGTFPLFSGEPAD